MKTICSACRREVNEKKAPPGWLWVCPACSAKAAEPAGSAEGAAIAAPSAAGSDSQADADVDVDVDVDVDADAAPEMARVSSAPVSLAPVSLEDAEVLSVPPPASPPLLPNPRQAPAARISGPASARRMARANPTQSAPSDEPAARPQSFAARLASKAFAQDPVSQVSPSDSAAAARAAADTKTAREEERLPDSGLFDIRSMIATPRGNAKETPRVNEDILNLSGGLFSNATSTPLVPLIAPDLSALNAPRPSQREVVASATAPQEPRKVAAQPKVRDGGAANAVAAPRGSGRMKFWALAVVALGLAGGAFVIARGDAASSGTKTSTAPDAQAAVAERPSSPIPQAAADPSPRPASKPIEEPSIDDGADSKAKPKDPEKQAPAGDSKPLVGGATAPARTTTTATGAAPTAATPTPAAPTPAAPPPAATAAAPPEGQPFNVGAASAALGAAAGQAAGCKAPGDPSGTARISVTFAPSGRATSANVNGPPFAGTPTGSCIASAFKRASVPPFSGSPTTVNKSVAIR
jgi:hypothetical protein